VQNKLEETTLRLLICMSSAEVRKASKIAARQSSIRCHTNKTKRASSLVPASHGLGHQLSTEVKLSRTREAHKIAPPSR
jgi:hypothetical protein